MPEESKSSSKIALIVIPVVVAIIACFGAIISAIIAKIPIPTAAASTPTPIIIVVTQTLNFVSETITPTNEPMFPPTSTSTVAFPLLSSTNTQIPPTQPPSSVGQESFQYSTIRQVSLKSGELIVGTAVKFAIQAYGCNTMNLNENIPYTVFLIRGPIDVNIEIYNGGWDHWVNIYDDSFAKSLLYPKIEEVKRHPNYPTVGHVECIIPPFK